MSLCWRALLFVALLFAGAEAKAVALSVTPSTIASGSAVTATWSDIVAPATNDWIGLFLPGDPYSSYFAWSYTTGAASGSLQLTIPAGRTPGTYELRLYQAGNVLRATSSAFTVTDPPPPVLSVAPSSVHAGSGVTAAWSNIVVPTANDWIGLFVPGASNSNYVSWQYTTGTSNGSMSFGIPVGQTPGPYELRLFQPGSVLRATSSTFAVTTPPPPTLSVVPTSIHAGSSVNASWSNIVVPAFTDWIGLFVPGASASNYISWRNTNGLASGSVPFTIPVGQKPGTYELRLYQTGNVLLATSSNLTVTTPPPPAISATPSSTPAGSSVTAAWSNIVTPAATDWIGLFVPGASNSSYSAWQYTTGTASGSMPFAIPIAQTPGAYELRLFQAGSVLRATGSSFAITPAPPPALSVSPTEVAAGDSVTAAWSNIIAPASSDWVGLFVPGNPDSAFISWRNTTGASSGSVPFSIPAAQALGNYELRLFQAGPILRATSNTFAVVPPPTVYFIHPDHLNSARAVYNDQQQLVWLHDQAEPFGNNPPDENPSGLGVFEFPLRESNYYDDKETGSFYAMQRDCYVPGLGRFCQSDPIGLGDGLNTYSYVRGNPLRGVDPFGLDTLVYKGGVLTHYDSSGNLVGSYAATSGVPGITDSSIRNQGPIPEGRYTVNPGEISPAGFVRRFLGDWGDYRVPAHADPGTQTFGRSGFFIHGGKEPGSAGCIDVGRADKTFFPRLRRVNEPVPLVVVR